ncbi:WD domain-containing protein [Histoplasma capsulatum G186AR]|uniref:Mitochondrial division protein 1 n=1 Tax=Ajellomyces capsulatus (strain G186AR / H82 / ATCC MYA-2454 / RMSCC 2432) TaxID=447093 RepID=C0NSF5_AJECG|nr:WD domain-containing protein [Histoplasma capsulatum G186AR]EEH05821.1 WD domain-containing protein [Histoplasma capsulatum G186AR]
MAEESHPSKKRRLENGYTATPETSSDELAANSDVERRGESWAEENPIVYRSSVEYKRDRSVSRSRSRSRGRSLSHSGSGSPDELAEDASTYWRRRRSGIHSMTSSREDSPQESDRPDGSENGPFDRGVSERSVELDSSSTPTPLSPSPPPKPERLYYREKYVLKGHQLGVSTVKFSPDGSMIASCCKDRTRMNSSILCLWSNKLGAAADATIKIWDTASGRLIHTFEGHLAGISTISWSPDGAIIASGSDDKSIRLWHVSTGKPHPNPFLGHHNYIYSVAFSPKGNMLVSGSYDEAVYLWDVRSARVMRSLPAHSDPVAGVDIVRDGTLIVSCASDGLIRIWDTGTGQCLRTLVHEDNPPVSAVKFSPNGKYVLAWTHDDCVRLWDYVEGRCIKTYQGHKNRKYSLSGAFGVYGALGGEVMAFAASGSEDGAVLCWDVVSKKVLQKLEGHSDVVLDVDTYCSGESRLIASCGLDRTIRVWEEEQPLLGSNHQTGTRDKLPEHEIPEDELSGVDDNIDARVQVDDDLDMDVDGDAILR